jgi:hypothetical protein
VIPPSLCLAALLALAATAPPVPRPGGQDSTVADETATAKKPSVLDLVVPPEVRKGRARWLGSWDEAVREATLRNCPIVVMHSNDQSEGWRTVSRLAYGEVEFAAFTQRCVMLASFEGVAHDHEEREIDGREVRWCRLYDCACDTHRRTHSRVKSLFVKGAAFQNPLHLFLEPGGFEILRVEGHHARLPELNASLKEAEKKLDGAPLDYARYREHLVTMRESLDLRHKKGWGRCIKQLREQAEDETMTLGLSDLVDRLERALLAEGRERLAEAQALIANGDEAAARKLVARILRDFRDTDVAKEARELRKKL